MRIAMAKLLLQEPDYLFLDEPTNHLDTAAKYWLMYDYIPSYPGTVICISHDVEFLNIVAEKIWEVDEQTVKIYSGNYDDYERLRTEKYERDLKAYDAQQREIADWKEFVARWRGNKSKAGMVASRINQLEKIDMLPKPKEKPRSIYLQFPEPPREAPTFPSRSSTSSKNTATKSFWAALRSQIDRGDKIALTGPNGAGKSTLLRLVAQEEKPTSGQRGRQRQDGDRLLCAAPGRGIWATSAPCSRRRSRASIRRWRSWRAVFSPVFQFRGEDAPFKKIGVLSGGERARVALAKFLLRPANFYLLDEPTNHLDPLARDVLDRGATSVRGDASHEQPRPVPHRPGRDGHLRDRRRKAGNDVLDPAIERMKRVDV